MKLIVSLPDTAMAQLREMGASTGRTTADLIGTGLDLVRVLVDAQARGQALFVGEHDGTPLTELEFPAALPQADGTP